MPGDGSWLPGSEGRIVDDLEDGETLSLLEFLEAGSIPSPELCQELAALIRFGRITAQKHKPQEFPEKLRRKISLGAWLWARRMCVEGETLSSAISEATSVKGLGSSYSTFERASSAFKEWQLKGDFEQQFYSSLQFRYHVIHISNELGLDCSELLSNDLSPQKLKGKLEGLN